MTPSPLIMELQELNRTGKLRTLYRMGIIQKRYQMMLEVWEQMDKEIRLGVPIMQAYANTAQTVGISERYVRLLCRMATSKP